MRGYFANGSRQQYLTHFWGIVILTKFRSCQNSVDVIIVTVVPDPELRAAARIFDLDLDQPNYIDASGVRFWNIALETAEHLRPLRLLITCIGDAGTADAGAFCGRLFERFPPRIALLSGIAAGIREKVKLGDCVIANLVMGYETERLTIDGPEPRFAWLAPPYRMRHELTYLRMLAKERFAKYFELAQDKLSAAESPQQILPEIHIGTIASGNKLFVDGKSLVALRKQYHEPIRAGEMEGIGFASAAERANICWAIIRGISDYGDPGTKEGKAKDRYHGTAANSALALSRAIVETASPNLLNPTEGGPERPEVSEAKTMLAHEILQLAQNDGLESGAVRSQVYARAIQWERLGLGDPVELLLAEKYRVEMDYDDVSRPCNVVTVSLINLGEKPVGRFEDVLTGTVAQSDADLRLHLLKPKTKAMRVSIDTAASTERRKHVQVEFSPLRRGHRVQFTFGFDWPGHVAKDRLRWFEFEVDFLVATLELFVRCKRGVRFLGAFEESGFREPRIIRDEDILIKDGASGLDLSLLRPRFNCKYRIGFEVNS